MLGGAGLGCGRCYDSLPESEGVRGGGGGFGGWEMLCRAP